ncbi:MAG: DNA polymerase III subunit delta [Halofilum sp. (in: g-proteobacteria)]|nr:DNA polymerase III subunit delta [Halofilum sp. (in: g-proteobacteria)]
MQLRFDQLSGHLKKGLLPVYLVTGDEPLQHAEATDAIRAAAREAGHATREVYDAGSDFDWHRLAEAADSRSLFAEQRLVDLRLPSGKPGREGGAALRAWCERPPEDTVLLIAAGKVDPQARNSAWYKAVAAAGAVVPVWPIELARLPEWIERRMRARGLEPTADAVALLAARVEGNLLAAAQEIDKLLLLGGAGTVDAERVAQVVADSARWSIFDLTDAMVAGQPARVARIVNGLRAEGAQPPMLIWALHRELDQLAAVAARVEGGRAPAAAMQEAGVWDRRKPLVGRALERHDARQWAGLAASCGRLDRLAKGGVEGSIWDELLECALIAAGASLPRLAPRQTVTVER